MRILLAIIVFFPLLFEAQITFFNSYGGLGNDYGKSIVTTLDTGYVVVGATESFGEGSTDLYLFKIDSVGNFLWSKTFGGNNVDWGYDLKQTPDSGFILCGYSNSLNFDYDVFVVKTDQNGDSLWTRRYGGNDWDFAYSVALTSDSAYVICGETYSYGTGTTDAYAIKLDVNGDVLWTKTYGGAGKDVFNGVVETSTGFLLFSGATETLDGDLDYLVVKTDLQGNEIWQYTAGDSLDEKAKQLIEVHDGNYFFTGTKESITGTNLDMEFQKLDTTGIFMLSNSYNNYLDETGEFIIQYKNSAKLLIGGRMNSYGNGGFDVLIAELNSGGGVDPAHSFTAGTAFDENVEMGDTTFDRGVVTVGTTLGTTNGISSVFILKSDTSYIPPAILNEVIDISGVESSLEKEQLFSVYPLPAQDVIYIKSEQNLYNKSYWVYNVQGAMVQKGIVYDAVDISQLRKGVYFIQIPELSKNSLEFTKL